MSATDTCTCVRCGECRGMGFVEYRTGSYPETDLETCDQCWGTGVSDLCDECQMAYEVEEWL